MLKKILKSVAFRVVLPVISAAVFGGFALLTVGKTFGFFFFCLNVGLWVGVLLDGIINDWK